MAIRIPLHYVEPNLWVPMEEITRHRNENLQSLIQQKKLHLVLGLDETLIYTVNIITKKGNDSCAKILKKSDMFMISDEQAIKLRPGVREFLAKANEMFDLSVYSLGDRTFANRVAHVLESEAEPVTFTCVMSREDCLNQYRIRKGLGNVLYHARVVLIVDDCQEFWPVNIPNLIQIGKFNKLDAQNQGIMDDELTRVFGILKMVHQEFYDGKQDYRNKDVRQILESVQQRLISGDVDAPYLRQGLRRRRHFKSLEVK